MADRIELPPDDDEPLGELPLIDSLHYERVTDGFSIIFVPSTSDEATQTVFVPRDSPEGRQVSAQVYRIQQLISNRIERVVHSGGGNYSLTLAGGDVLRLFDMAPEEQWAPEVFVRLKQIADVAEAAFRITHAGQP